MNVVFFIKKLDYATKSILLYKNYLDRKKQSNIIAFSYTKSTINEIYPIYKELKNRDFNVLLIYNGNLRLDNRYSKTDFIPSFCLKKLDVKIIIADGGGNWGKQYETIAIFHGFASIDCGFQRSFIENYKHIFMRLQYHEKQLLSKEFAEILNNKKLYRVGVPKLDGEILEVNNLPKVSYKSFFYAPTYHVEISSIFTFLNEIVHYTMDREIKLYIKLHPYLYKKSSYEASGNIDWKRKILKLAKSHNHIQIIPDEITFDELRRRFIDFDLIITDTSAMAYEFTLISGKPAVFIGDKLKIDLNDLRRGNLEKYMKYPEVYYRYEKLGPTIENPEDFAKRMDDFENTFDKYNKSINDFRSSFTFNLGKSTEIAVKMIEQILGEKFEN